MLEMWNLLWILLVSVAEAFPLSPNPKANRILCQLQQLADDYCSLPSVLPVFPLRKSVKLPTETLTLNLYEERYLAMSDFIVSRQNDGPMVFGAIYGSDKPQMVAKGVGPIVPLFEPGDIGTIFSVVRMQEGVRASTGGRRVQIFGVGVGRFRIERLLHNGYGGGVAVKEQGEDPLPFILVEPSRVQDMELNEMERQQVINLQEEFQKSMKGRRLPAVDESEEESSDKIEREKENASTATSISDSLTQKKLTADDFLLGMAPLDTMEIDQSYLLELFSFAAISSLTPNGSSKDMRRVLRMTCALQRLEYLQQDLAAK